MPALVLRRPRKGGWSMVEPSSSPVASVKPLFRIIGQARGGRDVGWTRRETGQAKEMGVSEVRYLRYLWLI